MIFPPWLGCHPQWRYMAAGLGLPMLPVTRLTVPSPYVSSCDGGCCGVQQCCQLILDLPGDSWLRKLERLEVGNCTTPWGCSSRAWDEGAMGARMEGGCSPAGLLTVTMRPPAERSRGSSPLVSSREPKKFTSMQVRNLPNGESSASAIVSLNPALFTRPQSPVGMGCLKR